MPFKNLFYCNREQVLISVPDNETDIKLKVDLSFILIWVIFVEFAMPGEGSLAKISHLGMPKEI